LVRGRLVGALGLELGCVDGFKVVGQLVGCAVGV
jgi:hypothetical protein